MTTTIDGDGNVTQFNPDGSIKMVNEHFPVLEVPDIFPPGYEKRKSIKKKVHALLTPVAMLEYMACRLRIFDLERRRCEFSNLYDGGCSITTFDHDSLYITAEYSFDGDGERYDIFETTYEEAAPEQLITTYAKSLTKAIDDARLRTKTANAMGWSRMHAALDSLNDPRGLRPTKRPTRWQSFKTRLYVLRLRLGRAYKVLKGEL